MYWGTTKSASLLDVPHESCGNVFHKQNLGKEIGRAAPTTEEKPLSFYKPITEPLGKRDYL